MATSQLTSTPTSIPHKHKPLPTPKPIAKYKLFLLAFIRPFFVANRAHQLSWIIALLLILIPTALTIFVSVVFIDASSSYISHTQTSSILNFLAYMPYQFTEHIRISSAFLPNSPLLLSLAIPLVFSLLIYPIHLIVSFILTPHLASPQQTYTKAWKLSHNKLAALYPPLAIIVCLCIFMINYPYVEYQQHFHTWTKQNPSAYNKYAMQMNDLQKLMNNSTGQARNQYSNKLYKLYEEQRQYQIVLTQKKEKHLKSASFLVRNYSTIPLYTTIPAGLLPLTILIIGFKNPLVRLRSPWPAYCEKCGYNIFSNDHQSVCPECSTRIENSLPPIHRIDLPFEQSTFNKPIKLLLSHIATAIQPLAAFKKFTHTIQTYNPSCHHRRFAFISMLWFLTTSFLTLNAYNYFFYIYNNSSQYHNSIVRNFWIEGNLVAIFFLPAMYIFAVATLPFVIWLLALIFTKSNYAFLCTKISTYLFGSLTYILLPAIPIYAWLILESQNPIILKYLNHGNKYIYLYKMPFEKQAILPSILYIYCIVMTIYVLYLNFRVINSVRYANA
ncbi:hypothetical protein JD969_19905 [Planctomycetota bacterium]|nr:hypothetical protein JD969_19905 [Planctomycetota bacterium]